MAHNRFPDESDGTDDGRAIPAHHGPTEVNQYVGSGSAKGKSPYSPYKAILDRCIPFSGNATVASNAQIRFPRIVRSDDELFRRRNEEDQTESTSGKNEEVVDLYFQCLFSKRIVAQRSL